MLETKLIVRKAFIIMKRHYQSISLNFIVKYNCSYNYKGGVS